MHPPRSATIRDGIGLFPFHPEDPELSGRSFAALRMTRKSAQDDGGTTSGREQVAELVPLRLQVARILIARRLDEGHALVESQTVALEADHLARVVRDRTDGSQPEV